MSPSVSPKIGVWTENVLELLDEMEWFVKPPSVSITSSPPAGDWFLTERALFPAEL